MSNLLKRNKIIFKISIIALFITLPVFIAGIIGTIAYFKNGDIIFSSLSGIGFSLEFGEYHPTGNTLLDILGKNAFGFVFTGLLYSALFIIALFTAHSVIKNPSKLKALAIESYDERTKLIRLRADSLAFNVISILLGLILAISSIINLFTENLAPKVAFPMLMGAFMIITVSRLVAEIYYQKRM